MRKQELLQLHGLFGELRRYLARQDDVHVPADAFAAYDEFGVTPIYVPAGKEPHVTAVELLVDGLVTAVTNHHDADEEAQPDADAAAEAAAEAAADADVNGDTQADADVEGTVVAHPTD